MRSAGVVYICILTASKRLFLAVLEKEKEETDDDLEPALSKVTSSADILVLFLQEQKKRNTEKDRQSETCKL